MPDFTRGNMHTYVHGDDGSGTPSPFALGPNGELVVELYSRTAECSYDNQSNLIH